MDRVRKKKDVGSDTQRRSSTKKSSGNRITKEGSEHSLKTEKLNDIDHIYSKLTVHGFLSSLAYYYNNKDKAICSIGYLP